MPQPNVRTLIENFTNDILEMARLVVLDELEQRFGPTVRVTPRRKTTTAKTTRKAAPRRPDRVSQETLSCVEEFMVSCKRRVTSTEVADALGIGETSARNALKALCGTDQFDSAVDGRKVVYFRTGVLS